MADPQLSQRLPVSQSPQLWEKALGQLEPGVKARLMQVTGGRGNIVAALIKTVNEKRQLCIRRQYKFKTPSGRVVIIRDLLEKMAKWLDRFKGAVDAAVQYDPAHAALPWAAVRFILQIALDDIQAHGSIFEAVESFTRMMGRCAKVEELHLDKTNAATVFLEEALTRLYASILSALATALKYFDRSHAARLFTVIIEPSVLDTLEDQEQEVLKLVSLLDSETIKRLDQQFQRVMDTSTMIKVSMSQTRSVDCLAWLSGTRVHDHHRSMSAAKIPGSCTWIFEQETYRTWLGDSSSSVLILQGIRGCGKSVLMSAIIDSLRERTPASTTPSVPCAFFYCADLMTEPDRSSPDAILRSIIRQLAVVAVDESTCTIDEKLWKLYSQKLDAAQPDKIDLPVLTCEECYSLLLEMTLTNPAYLVIDAVDELSDKARVVLLGLLHRVLSMSGSLVKILISSRNDTQIEALLPSQTLRLRISAKMTDGDMTTFIHGQVNDAVSSARLLHGNIGPALVTRIIDVLKQGAREMFQWVILQMNFLCTRTSEQDIVNTIESGLTETLDELYSDSFGSLLAGGSFSRDVAIHVFSWLLYGNSTLTGEAMLYAIKQELATTEKCHWESGDLVRICHHLVVYDTEQGIYRFCHPSAADFLRREPELAAPSANSILAAACLHQCVDMEADDLPTSDDGPIVNFHSYAALHWWDHVRKSGDKDSLEGPTNSIMFEFVFDGNEPEISLAFYLWIDWMHLYAEALPIYHARKRLFGALWSTEGQPIFTASQFGLTALMRRYLEANNDIDVDTTNDIGHTGFYLAAAGGHTEIVRMLHERNANAHIRCGWLGSPLQAACFHGKIETARLLLELGASARAEAKFSSALEAACRGNRPEVAQMLLEQGSVLETEDDFEAAVRWSTETGLEAVVDWLLKFAKPKSRPSAADQATHLATAAIKRGSIRNLKRLLAMNSSAEQVAPRDGIAIASYYGHVEMIEYLHELGLSLDVEGPYGSPLRSACLAGNEAAARLLISWGLDVDTRGEKGHALQAAAMQGHTRLVLLLISEGADVNTGIDRSDEPDPLGTPLEAASYYGNSTVVDILLKAGASPGAGGYFKDAMHAAIEGNQSAVAVHLLQAGYKVEKSLFGTGPAALMNPLGSKRMAELVASKVRRTEASPYNAKCYVWLTGDDEYALSQCAARGKIDVADALIQKVYPLPWLNSSMRWTLLESIPIAASNGHLDMIKMLMAHYTNFSTSITEKPFITRAQNSILRVIADSLTEASSNGHTQTVAFLATHLHDATLASEPGRAGHRMGARLTYTTLSKSLSKASRNQHKETLDHFWSLIVSWGDFSPLEHLVQLAVLFGSEDVLKLFIIERTKSLDLKHVTQIFQIAARTVGTDDNSNFAQLILSLADDCRGGELNTISIAFTGYISACISGNPKVALLFMQGFHGKNLSNSQKLQGWIAAAIKKRDKTLMAILSHIEWMFITELDRGLLQDAFVIASANGNIDAARMIYSHAFADEAEDTKQSVLAMGLMAACFQLSREGVILCIQLGANVNAIISISNEICQRYAAFIDYSDDDSDPRGKVLDRYLSDKRLSSGLFTSTQAVLGQFYKDTRVWQSTAFNVCNTFLRTFNESNTLSHINLESGVPFSIDEEEEEEEEGEEESLYIRESGQEARIMQLLIDAGLNLEPSGLHRPMKDMQALFLWSLPYWVQSRSEILRRLDWTAEKAVKSLNGGIRDLILQLFRCRPSLRAQGIEFAMWLIVASAAGDEVMLDVLVDKGVSVNSTLATFNAINAAAMMGHLSVVKKLHEAGALIVYDEASLRRVFSGNHVEVFEYLQENGLQADWSETRHCLVCEALDHGSMSIMKRLVDTTTQLHDHTLALIKICGSDKHSSDQVQMIQYLVDKKANLTLDGTRQVGYASLSTSPLIEACSASNMELVKFLLAHGADVGMPVQHGELNGRLDLYASTPLIAAAGLGNLQIVRILLENGADPNQVCRYSVSNWSTSTTPLSQACKNGRKAVVKELLSLDGLSRDSAQFSDAITCAMAARRGQKEILELLLKRYLRSGMDEGVMRKALEKVPKWKPELVDVLLEYSPSDIVAEFDT